MRFSEPFIRRKMLKCLLISTIMFLTSCPRVSMRAPVSEVSASSSTSTDQYKLLIIAPDEFMGALEPLKEFKDATDRPTLLLSLEEIYSDPSFDGADEAEEVKKCIAHCESTYGVKYVMLVGDCDRFPMRAHRVRSENVTHVIREVFYLTDHYYADLYSETTGDFCDWDYNNNGLYGEANSILGVYKNVDHVDFHLDVAVGRVPASTVWHVHSYVNKIIQYETTTSPDSQWFRRVLLLTGTDGGRYGGDVTQNDDIASKLAPLGFEAIKLYNASGYVSPNPARINERLNEGVGFVNSVSHGLPYEWCYCYDVTNDMVGLDNSETLPVIWSFGCDTAHFGPIAPFERYIDVNGVMQPGGYTFPYLKGSYVEPPPPNPLQKTSVGNADVDSMAEYWTVTLYALNIGGIAFVGPTAASIAPQGFDTNDYFIDAFTEGKRILGDMWLTMVEKYLADPTYDPWHDRPAFTRLVRRNLFGDPSLWIGGVPLQKWAVGSWDILHWDGAAWVRTLSFDNQTSLRSVSLVSPTDGWAVGEGRMMRWTGRTWDVLNTPPTTSDLYAVDMVGRRDGWAVGAGGTIIRWDGNHWSNFPSPTSLDLYSVHMVSPIDGLAVGYHILHWNGTSWQNLGPGPRFRKLYSVCMITQDDGWIVGAHGTILHWDGVGWSSVSNPTSEDLRSVSMVKTDFGYAVGHEGTILYWDGSSWRIQGSPTTANLYSVSVVGYRFGSLWLVDGWAVGAGGTILNFWTYPHDWVIVPTPTTGDLYSITCDPISFPPLADCNGPYAEIEGTPVTLNASDCYDPEEDALTYLWDFGDGNRTTTTEQLITHTYSQGGRYNVTLFVSDGTRWDTAKTYVEVAKTGDVAVLGAGPARMRLPDPFFGMIMPVVAVVENQGAWTTTFDVTIFYDATVIGTSTVTLDAGETTTVSFSWPRPPRPPPDGAYTISANASIVGTEIVETDPADNNFVNGEARKTFEGEVNADGIVDDSDLFELSESYGSTTLSEDINSDGIVDYTDYGLWQIAMLTGTWNPYADIDDSGLVDIIDFFLWTAAFGQTGSPNWNPYADMNADNKIDASDLCDLSENYEKSA